MRNSVEEALNVMLDADRLINAERYVRDEETTRLTLPEHGSSKGTDPCPGRD